MAIGDELPPNIESMLNEEAGTTVDMSAVKTRTIYQVYPGSRAPVSKRYGPMWKERLDAAVNNRAELEKGWDENIRYYNNDQQLHREKRNNTSGNRRLSKRRNASWSETENVIFSGINAMIPAIYAKNPDTEFNAYEEADKPFATMHERLSNALMSMRVAPGIGAKNKIKQSTVLASLTNSAWIEIGYQHFEDSNEAVIAALNDIGEKLAKAKHEEEIQRLEGDLEALESKFAIARPSGPLMRMRTPHDVVVDPNSIEPDHSDARWMMVCDMLPTQFIVAKYGSRVEKDSEYAVQSLYKPTHVLPIESANGVDENQSLVNNFKLVKNDGFSPTDYGYANKEDFDNAAMTKVWYVWDRTTRRVFMYHDDDWTWPLWVWDDPLHLPRFFPLFKLSFIMPPVGSFAKAETSYVLDQQDAVNEINDEWRRARQRVKQVVLFNGSVLNQKDVEAVLKGDDGTARAVPNVPDGAKMEDLFYTPTPHVVQYRELFDTAPKMASIDRIYGINEVLRGAQFKTNTTNQAINTYNSVSSMRLDEKIDIMEDFVGEVMHNIAMLCAQFMQREQVASIIGESASQLWENMPPADFMLRFNMRVVGGSTQKPTSAMKKQEAMQTGQVLGQFASVTPVALEIFVKLLESSFDSVTIKEEDWTRLRESVNQLMQAQQAKASAAPAGGGAAAPRGTAAAGGASTSPAAASPPQQLAQLLDSMPEQLRRALGQVLSEGIPASEALPAIMAQIQQRAGSPTGMQQ